MDPLLLEGKPDRVLLASACIPKDASGGSRINHSRRLMLCPIQQQLQDQTQSPAPRQSVEHIFHPQPRSADFIG